MIDAELFARLAQPFDPSEVRWKPQTVSGTRAMVIAYVDARVIQDRLDEVLGGPNWKDHYSFLGDGNVLCQLSVRYRDEWITKEDVGGQSEQPDEGDRCKAAVSDALKRAAVKFGIGRYLYRLPKPWVDYDPQKKRVLGTPTLPPEALPKGAKPAPPAAPDENAVRRIDQQQRVEIYELLKRTETDPARFCAYYGIGDVPDLAAVCFEDAAGQLRKKLNRAPAPA